MTSTSIDRLTRTLSRLVSRRAVLLGASAVVGVTAPRRTDAELKPPSCAGEGEVCTHLVGCCGGLLCATSMINTNYGVCIPGDGDIAPVTDALVTPGDDAMVGELGEELADREAEGEVAADVLDERADRRQKQRDRRRARKRARQEAKRAKRTSPTQVFTPTPTPTP